MDFPLWALSLKTFHNTQSPSENFWSRHFWGCHVYAHWRAHRQMRKGKTGSRGILRSWYHRWGLQDNTGKGKEKNPTINQKSENETTAGQRPLILLWELSNSSYKSLPHRCQDRATWKLAAGSSPHWNLVQGLMSAFYSMGNYPSYTETTQNKGIHSTWWAALTKQDWHQGSTTKPQAAVHGHDFHKPMRDWRVWGYGASPCPMCFCYNTP